MSAEALFEDILGLPQYIGPTGSYTMLVDLRQLLSVWHSPLAPRQEAAQTMGVPTGAMLPGLAVEKEGRNGLDLPPRHISDALVEVFFAKVHRDYPVFHRAPFQTTYESMWARSPEVNPAWLMSLYMVIVLALEVSPDNGARGQRLAAKSRYLSKVKTLFPEVIVGCTLAHVQALMLYCLHLHISRERNACWNIAGSAIRIAVAIGLHRNGSNLKCSPLERELRKRVWWTLYAFEAIECSSLGRPSAVNDSECNAVVPTEGFLDLSDIIPIDYLGFQAELLLLIRDICKNEYKLRDESDEQGRIAQQLLYRLETWEKMLPLHLRLGCSGSPTSHLRSIIMLHIQYRYALVLLSRPFLGTKARGSGAREGPLGNAIDTFSQIGIDSSTVGINLLQGLFDNGCFNSKTAWDVYYMESFSMMLALGRLTCDGGRDARRLALIIESLERGIRILKACDGFSPTMGRFADVTADFSEALVAAAKRSDVAENTPTERYTNITEPV